MVELLVKPQRGVDYYAVWCTNVDDFLAGGPKGSQELWITAPERFARADASGSSHIPGLGKKVWFGWHWSRFLLHRGTGSAWWLHRSDIRKYLEWRERGVAVDSLLELVEDDQAPVRSLTMEDLRARRGTGRAVIHNDYINNQSIEKF